MYFATAPAFVILSSILISVLILGGLLCIHQSLSAQTYLFSIIISLGIGSSLLKFTEFMDNFYHIKNGMKLIREALNAPELREAVPPEITKIQGNSIVFNTLSNN